MELITNNLNNINPVKCLRLGILSGVIAIMLTAWGFLYEHMYYFRYVATLFYISSFVFLLKFFKNRTSQNQAGQSEVQVPEIQHPGTAGSQGQQHYPGTAGSQGQQPYPGTAGSKGQQPYPGTAGSQGQQPYPGTAGSQGQQPYPATGGVQYGFTGGMESQPNQFHTGNAAVPGNDPSLPPPYPTFVWPAQQNTALPPPPPYDNATEGPRE